MPTLPPVTLQIITWNNIQTGIPVGYYMFTTPPNLSTPMCIPPGQGRTNVNGGNEGPFTITLTAPIGSQPLVFELTDLNNVLIGCGVSTPGTPPISSSVVRQTSANGYVSTLTVNGISGNPNDVYVILVQTIDVYIVNVLQPTEIGQVPFMVNAPNAA